MRAEVARAATSGVGTRHRSEFSTVVGPVKKRLSLAFAAGLVTGLAVKFDLPDVSPHCLPAPNLSKVFLRHSAAHIIPAIPLKPAARIVGVYPSIFAPDGQWLAGIHTEVVERAIATVSGKFCFFKPALGKFVSCIGHVLASKYTQLKHLLRCQLRTELGIEVATRLFRKIIAIPLLHFVIHCNGSPSHSVPSFGTGPSGENHLMGRIKYVARSQYWLPLPINTFPTWSVHLTMSVRGGKADLQPTSRKRREWTQPDIGGVDRNAAARRY